MGRLRAAQWEALARFAHAAEHRCGVLTPDDLGNNAPLTLRALLHRRLITLAEGEVDGDGVLLYRITLGGLAALRARRPRAAANTRELTLAERRAVRASRLPQSALAEKYGVSRRTVRKALGSA